MGHQCYSCYANPNKLHEKWCYLEKCPNCNGILKECKCTDINRPCPKGWEKRKDIDFIHWFPPDELRIPWSDEKHLKERGIQNEKNI